MKYEDCKEVAKEMVNTMISNDIRKDIEYGESLLANCKEISLLANNKDCPIKDTVIKYMEKMSEKYGVFNLLYNYSKNGCTTNVSNAPKCVNLEIQINIIKMVKQVKDEKDSTDKISKIINLFNNFN